MFQNFTSIISHSLELDTELAVHELIDQANRQLNGKMPQAGLLFLGIDYDHPAMIEKLMEEWPQIQLIGCTTDGELSSLHGYQEDSSVLLLFVSDHLKIVSGYIDHQSEDLNLACKVALNHSMNQLEEKPSLCILLSDVLKINGEQIVQYVSELTDKVVPIVGGISADRWEFKQVFQFCNDTISPDISPYLLISGDFDLAWGIDSGWEPYGEMGTITKSKDNVVYEINHRPALEFYQEILGEGARPTLELPIAIHDQDGNYQYLRTSFENYDRTEGSITYLGNIPEGCKVRITMVSRESILSGVSSALEKALTSFPQEKTPSLVLCFSCSARRVLLGTRTKEEFQIVQNRIQSNTPLIGYYTYGEICPNRLNTATNFHNETFVVVLLG